MTKGCRASQGPDVAGTLGIKGRPPKTDQELKESLASDEGKAATMFESASTDRWGERTVTVHALPDRAGISATGKNRWYRLSVSPPLP